MNTKRYVIYLMDNHNSIIHTNSLTTIKDGILLPKFEQFTKKIIVDRYEKTI